jgi:hypothetical protein
VDDTDRAQHETDPGPEQEAAITTGPADFGLNTDTTDR